MSVGDGLKSQAGVSSYGKVYEEQMIYDDLIQQVKKLDTPKAKLGNNIEDLKRIASLELYH